MSVDTQERFAIADIRRRSRLVLSAVFLVAAGVGLLGQWEADASRIAQTPNPDATAPMLIQSGVELDRAEDCADHPV